MATTKPIYLDYAAATPTDPIVLQKMLPFFTDEYYNPSATYSAGIAVRLALDEARTTVAHWLGAKSSEIIFTAGGTEANNLAIHGIMQQYPDAEIIISAIEHESVQVPAHRYACSEIVVEPDGIINLDKLANSITDKTVLISIMQANNEMGAIQPLREVSAMVADIRIKRGAKGNSLPLLLHTDACQAANYLDIHVARLGVDLLTINGGKIYGPKQSGALYVKGGVVLQPVIDGGGQERNLRSGTENVAGAIGLAVALDIAQHKKHDEVARLRVLQQRWYQQLEANVPSAIVNGSRKKRLPNNVHITIPGSDNERLLIQLDSAGVMAAAGSACSASNDEPSHVLRAMGLSEANAQASLRFTMGRQTIDEDVTRTISLLAEFAA